MCTVKDHFFGEVKNNNAYRSKANVLVEVADLLVSFVIFNVVLLQLLLSYSHITSLVYVNPLQSTDILCIDFYWIEYDEGIKVTTTNILLSLIIDQKVINHCQKNFTSNTEEPQHMATSSLFTDNEMHHDDLVATCVAIILFCIVLLSAFYDDLNDNSLQDVKYKRSCKHGKLYTSESLANSKSPSEEMLFVTESQGYVGIQAIGILENISSCKVCFRNIFEGMVNQLADVAGCIYLLYTKFEHRNLLPVSFLRSDICKQVKLERHAKGCVCKQECETGFSNPQLFAGKTILSSQSQKLFSVKEGDNVFTKECKGLLSERQREYLLPESNVIIESYYQCSLGKCIPWTIPVVASDEKLFIEYPCVTLHLLPEFTLNNIDNGDLKCGFMHAKNLSGKSVGCLAEKDKGYSESCNTVSCSEKEKHFCIFCLQFKCLCTHLVKPNLNSNVFVIEMVNDSKGFVYHDILMLLIDLRRCSDLTPEITASLLFNAANKKLSRRKKLYSHFIDKNFYMSCLQTYAVDTTKPKKDKSFQGTHTQLVITIYKTVTLLIVTGLTPTVHCFSDIAYAAFRPVGKPNVNRQSVSKSRNQQQSFASHGDCRDSGRSVRSANEHTEGKQEDMLQSSAATESNDQPLQIKPEGYHMSVSTDDTDFQEDTVQRDGGHSPLLSKDKDGMLSASTSKQDVVKKDGKASITSGIEARNQDKSNYNDLTPVGKDHVGTNPMNHEVLASQRDHHNAADNFDKQLHNQQSNAATKEGDRPLFIQPESYHMAAASNVKVHSSRKEKNVGERDGQSSLHIEKNQNVVSNLERVEKDGKLSMASGIDQATLLSSIPTAHKLMIGNVTPKSLHSDDQNSLGAQFIKGSPRETEVLPTPGPQLDAMYNTNFDHEVQGSREEVRRRGNARTTFYQHEVEQRAYNPMKIGELNSTTTNPPTSDRLQVKPSEVKPPEVKVETGKGANDFKPKPLPKRSCIVFGNKQYPLGNNLVSLPHMDHYFVKERKEIRPSHYLAKLVLRHQYQNRYKYTTHYLLHKFVLNLANCWTVLLLIIPSQLI